MSLPGPNGGIVALSGLDSRTAALSQLNSGMPAISRLWSGAGVNSPFSPHTSLLGRDRVSCCYPRAGQWSGWWAWLGAAAGSRLQDIPSYSTSTPRGTGAAVMMGWDSGMAADRSKSEAVGASFSGLRTGISEDLGETQEKRRERDNCSGMWRVLVYGELECQHASG